MQSLAAEKHRAGMAPVGLLLGVDVRERVVVGVPVWAEEQRM